MRFTVASSRRLRCVLSTSYAALLIAGMAARTPAWLALALAIIIIRGYGFTARDRLHVESGPGLSAGEHQVADGASAGCGREKWLTTRVAQDRPQDLAWQQRRYHCGRFGAGPQFDARHWPASPTYLKPWSERGKKRQICASCSSGLLEPIAAAIRRTPGPGAAAAPIQGRSGRRRVYPADRMRGRPVRSRQAAGRRHRHGGSGKPSSSLQRRDGDVAGQECRNIRSRSIRVKAQDAGTVRSITVFSASRLFWAQHVTSSTSSAARSRLRQADIAVPPASGRYQNLTVSQRDGTMIPLGTL